MRREAALARRRAHELEVVNQERTVRHRMGELALQILKIQAVEIVMQVAMGYFGGKLVRVADVHLARVEEKISGHDSSHCGEDWWR